MSLINCPECQKQISDKSKICVGCGFPICEFLKKEVEEVEEEAEFNGIYRYSFWGKPKEVYCPRCGSENCSYFTEQKIIPGKTKTKYTANLNPLKPFTLVNKKEKVVRKDFEYTKNKISCNDCGKIFY